MLPVGLEQVKPKHLAAHWVIWRARETLGNSVSDVEAQALADTMADAVLEAKA